MTRRTARLRAPADFGLALQQARLERETTQEQLATLLDLPQSTVSAMENGKSTIYLRRLLELADALGIELTATWGDDDASRR